jgi:hypothetical protein
MKISISLDEDELKILKRRDKNNLLTLREQVEDIVRRSCVSSKGQGRSRFKTDDKLVAIFSREKRGRKAKKKVKKK